MSTCTLRDWFILKKEDVVRFEIKLWDILEDLRLIFNLWKLCEIKGVPLSEIKLIKCEQKSVKINCNQYGESIWRINMADQYGESKYF